MQWKDEAAFAARDGPELDRVAGSRIVAVHHLLDAFEKSVIMDLALLLSEIGNAPRVIDVVLDGTRVATDRFVDQDERKIAVPALAIPVLLQQIDQLGLLEVELPVEKRDSKALGGKHERLRRQLGEQEAEIPAPETTPQCQRVSSFAFRLVSDYEEVRAVVADRRRVSRFREVLDGLRVTGKLGGQFHVDGRALEFLWRRTEDPGQSGVGEFPGQRLHDLLSLVRQGVTVHGELCLRVFGHLFVDLLEHRIPCRQAGRCGRTASGGRRRRSRPVQPRFQKTVQRIHQVRLAGIVAAGDDRQIAELHFGVLDRTDVPERERDRFEPVVACGRHHVLPIRQFSFQFPESFPTSTAATRRHVSCPSPCTPA